MNKFFNRELSLLSFNERVLSESLRKTNPLIERLKFISICSSNLDEFFMVRVAGMLEILRQEIKAEYFNDVNIHQLVDQVREQVLAILDVKSKSLKNVLLGLKSHNVEIVELPQISNGEREFLSDYFLNKIFPILTPLSYDASQPFPFFANLELYLLLVPKKNQLDFLDNIPKFCCVGIPSNLPRFIKLPTDSDEKIRFIKLEDLIVLHLNKIFLNVEFAHKGLLRVTRNLDYNLLEADVTDLLKAIQKEIVSREHQEVVRLEIDKNVSEHVLDVIAKKLRVHKNQVYEIEGLVDHSSLMELAKIKRPDLKFKPFNPRLPRRFSQSRSIFELISDEDILVHHPFDSFYIFTEFLSAATHDPNVLAIKQMLYRTGDNSPIVKMLIEAANSGKHVTAVVELKARFDEKNNIVWARELESAGVNVVYGYVDLKTHSKACMIARRENGLVQRYAHLSTGNYNPSTARLYTDVGFFTKNVDICEDVSRLFNLVTGINFLQPNMDLESVKPYLPKMNALVIAPVYMRGKLLELIDIEIENKNKKKQAEICIKVNSMVDRELIEKFYEASNAGVKITLLVRGVCSLVPGVKKQSENIRVFSIIGRFLEHSRIFWFASGGQSVCYVGSADCMQRNFDRRIEVLFPIENPKLKKRIRSEILDLYLTDNTHCWELKSDGQYEKLKGESGDLKIDAQERFIEITRSRGLKLIPYDESMVQSTKKTKVRRPLHRYRKKRKSAKNQKK